jgi:hypothetical protein
LGQLGMGWSASLKNKSDEAWNSWLKMKTSNSKILLQNTTLSLNRADFFHIQVKGSTVMFQKN